MLSTSGQSRAERVAQLTLERDAEIAGVRARYDVLIAGINTSHPVDFRLVTNAPTRILMERLAKKSGPVMMEELLEDLAGKYSARGVETAIGRDAAKFGKSPEGLRRLGIQRPEDSGVQGWSLDAAMRERLDAFLEDGGWDRSEGA